LDTRNLYLNRGKLEGNELHSVETEFNRLRKIFEGANKGVVEGAVPVELCSAEAERLLIEIRNAPSRQMRRAAQARFRRYVRKLQRQVR
jgi:hypothetical protein